MSIAATAAVAPPAAPIVPAYAGSRRVAGSTTELRGPGGPVARVATMPRLRQASLVARAAAAHSALRAVNDDAWFGIFADAADRLAGTAALAAMVSATTGLPVRRVVRAIESLATDLRRMPEILAAQSPDGTVAPYRTGRCGRPWTWAPAGRNVAVRIPSNAPTINVEWLQALGARRPVLLVASERDPFTPTALAEALYGAGLPDGALVLCHRDAPPFWRLADQVLWPGPGAPVREPGAVKAYHNGRSKAVVNGDEPDDVWPRLAAIAVRGGGRLCTNVSAVLVTGGPAAAARVAERLAAAFADHPVLPLDDPRASIPAFPVPGEAEVLAARVEHAIARGARDVTAEALGVPLRADAGGAAFLRPTVLLVDMADPDLGVELPFPFLTVAAVPRAAVAAACTASLVVAVPGADEALVAELLDLPGVDKVFAGNAFDHDYDPAEPHEGYLADFLFRKKAVAGTGAR